MAKENYVIWSILCAINTTANLWTDHFATKATARLHTYRDWTFSCQTDTCIYMWTLWTVRTTSFYTNDIYPCYLVKNPNWSFSCNTCTLVGGPNWLKREEINRKCGKTRIIDIVSDEGRVVGGGYMIISFRIILHLQNPIYSTR